MNVGRWSPPTDRQVGLEDLVVPVLVLAVLLAPGLLRAVLEVRREYLRDLRDERWEMTIESQLEIFSIPDWDVAHDLNPPAQLIKMFQDGGQVNSQFEGPGAKLGVRGGPIWSCFCLAGDIYLGEPIPH